MIRMVGAVLVAFGAAWIGLGAAAELGKQVRRLEALSAGLELLELEPFSVAWRRLVGELEKLTPEGRAALLPLGEVLGRYEARGQREAIAQARSALERERARAEGEKLRMGRVYQALGLSGGAFLVILLL